MTEVERFESHTKQGPRFGRLGYCSDWTAATDKDGYGLFKVSGRMVRAHRWRWKQKHGPVPYGLQLNHLCERPVCVRDSHLEPATPRENLMYSDTPAAREVQLTHCPQRHPYSGDNLYRYKNERQCRICRRAADQRYRDKHRRKAA